MEVVAMLFTDQEQAILSVLSDGLPHHPDELLRVMFDDLGTRVNLQVAVSKLRKKLLPKGEYIVCEWRHRQGLYRHVRLLRPLYQD